MALAGNPLRAIREKLFSRRRASGTRAEQALRRKAGQARHREHSSFGDDSLGTKGHKLRP